MEPKCRGSSYEKRNTKVFDIWALGLERHSVRLNTMESLTGNLVEVQPDCFTAVLASIFFRQWRHTHVKNLLWKARCKSEV